jgi:hypothetical protein
MSTFRTHLKSFSEMISEPDWLDLCLVVPIMYTVMMRVHYDSYEGLAGAWARWALSIALALYGATVAMSVLVLAGRGLRPLDAALRGADKGPV